MEGDLITKLVVGSIYGVSTAFGSITMMHIMLKNTKGKSRVGARAYKLTTEDIHMIDSLTNGKYNRKAITNALISAHGDLADTLKNLLG
jgi:hypothetical protein